MQPKRTLIFTLWLHFAGVSLLKEIINILICFCHTLILRNFRRETFKEGGLMKKNILMWMAVAAGLMFPRMAGACTGITLKSSDGATVLARTIEWGGSDLNSRYVVVPRGYEQQAYVTGGQKAGMKFTARYGYVGVAVELEDFVAEGLNEAGLSAGLFYFPNYGGYETYDPAKGETSISDLQLVPWMLAGFKTVDEVKEAIRGIHVVSSDPRASTAHWRIADASGRQVVLEIVDGKPCFYENPLGVLTNSPGFEWQMTNLNNYVNLFPGGAEKKQLDGVTLSAFGAGSGFLGIPGDVTPPSRFVRAAFYQASSPVQATPRKTVLQAFQILNNFDIPVGIEFPDGKVPADIPSATQWTSATDVRNLVFYYRTMWNSAIRSIDLKAIDFSKVKYRSAPVDEVKEQPIVPLALK